EPRDERGIRDLRERVEVRAGGEGGRLPARDDEALERTVGLERVERLVEIAEQRQVDHRERAVGGVEGDGGGRVLGPFDADARTLLRRVLRQGEAGDVDHAGILSRTTAPPWPPPMHKVARPKRCFLSSSSVATVKRRREPVAPTGCPSAIAPPFRFVR